MEALDDETLIVYAGARECAFRVELRGIGCRLSFAMDVNFVQREPGSGSVTTNRPVRYESPSRVCSYTPRVELFTGIYDPATEQAVGGDADPFDGACRVVNVDALTDDELVELYVDRGRAAPPPPMGSGSLETPEQQDAESGETDEAGQEQDGDAPETAQDGAEPADAAVRAR